MRSNFQSPIKAKHESRTRTRRLGWGPRAWPAAAVILDSEGQGFLSIECSTLFPVISLLSLKLRVAESRARRRCDAYFSVPRCEDLHTTHDRPPLLHGWSWC